MRCFICGKEFKIKKDWAEHEKACVDENRRYPHGSVLGSSMGRPPDLEEMELQAYLDEPNSARYFRGRG